MVYNLENILKIILSDKYDKINPYNSLSTYISKSQLLTIDKNHTIIFQNDTINYFYILLSGRTIILNHNEWTKDDIIDYVEPLHILGLIEYLNNISTYTAFVVAETKCILFKISASDFIKIIKNDPELCYLTLVNQGKSSNNNMAFAELSNIFHPKDKLGYYLFIQSQNNIPYICHLTRNDLSIKLHINLRTLHRYINSFKYDGYLSIQKGKICIKKDNYDKLSQRYSNIIL